MVSKCEWAQQFPSAPRLLSWTAAPLPNLGERWASFLTLPQETVLAHQRKHTLLGFSEDSVRDLALVGPPGHFLDLLSLVPSVTVLSATSVLLTAAPSQGRPVPSGSCHLLELSEFYHHQTSSKLPVFLWSTHDFWHRLAGQIKLEKCHLTAWSLWVLSEPQLHWKFVVFSIIFVSPDAFQREEVRDSKLAIPNYWNWCQLLFFFPKVFLLRAWIGVLIFCISHSIQHAVKQMDGWVKEFPWRFLIGGTSSPEFTSCAAQDSEGPWGAWALWRFASVLFMLHVAESAFPVWLHRVPWPPQSKSSWPGSDKKFSVSGVYSNLGKEGLPGHWLVWEFTGFHTSICIFICLFSPSKIFDHLHCARHGAARLNALRI